MAMNVCLNEVDISHNRLENSQVSENQEIVKIFMDIILYLSKFFMVIKVC